ncbi:hypothetical protein HDE79_001414 [Rhodanobacter sp. MP1X3]|nr:hypothetical protein [Rhodanobacter sp. MP1X3]
MLLKVVAPIALLLLPVRANQSSGTSPDSNNTRGLP